MPVAPTSLEIAHVLFLDIVGYSRRPMDAQARLIAGLQQRLRGLEDFRRAEAAGNLLCLPTGDGVALVFFGDPQAPARCALDLARALRAEPSLELRMGIHSGPVYHVEDINANQNVAGGGINFAQRVMDCGDAGHILVSRTVAEMLGQLSRWEPLLHDLGECEVKHGVRVHLYNLFGEDAGNPALPARLAAPARGAPADAPMPGAADPPADRGVGAGGAPAPPRPPAGAVGRVALLYKRHAAPDESLLAYLEQGLRARGCEVFIDRHLTVGIAWAQEIERQVRQADFVVPLLSQASLSSEMLACEVQMAHDAAQERGGKPRLCPVRIAYEGPLPEALALVLGPLQYTLWSAPGDEARILQDLLRAFAGGSLAAAVPVTAPAPAPPAAEGPVEAFGGAVPLGSPFYLERSTDRPFLEAIARRESLVLVRGARQMGKTSLLARGLQRARELGARTIHTDFQKLTAPDLENADRFFRTLGGWVADQLDLDVLPEDVWNPHRSPSLNFERYVRREALEKLTQPVVWGLDEVDRLFPRPFAGDVFGLFRSWHNERSLNPDRAWSRLTLTIAYATEAHLFITDIHQSPFNVGVRLALSDFTFDQVRELNRRHGSPVPGEADLSRFHRLVGGHPYLVRRGLYELADRGLSVAELEREADSDGSLFGDHLRRLLFALSSDPALAEAVREQLRGRSVMAAESFYRLRSAGVLAGDIPREAHFRCPLYAAYLERHLL